MLQVEWNGLETEQAGHEWSATYTNIDGMLIRMVLHYDTLVSGVEVVSKGHQGLAHVHEGVDE